jgi:hypothetical protein
MSLAHLLIADQQPGRAVPKPETRKRIKGRKVRAEAKVKKFTRAKCVERDDYCRLMRDNLLAVQLFDACGGPSQWAHLEDKKRARTRGQAPEMRHTRAGSLMLCEKHHTDYDHGRIKIGLSPAGADGPLRWRRA